MERKIIWLIAVPFLLFWHWFEPVARKNQEGMRAYGDKKYETALGEFLSAKGMKPHLPELKNNTASALYQLKKYKEALEEFSKINPGKSRIPRADFSYNLGNSYFRLQQFEKALENYKNCLLHNPEDLDAKINYELTLQKLRDKKNQQDQKPGDADKQKKENQSTDDQNSLKKKEKQHNNLMQFLDQNEKKQMEKKKRRISVVKKERDW